MSLPIYRAKRFNDGKYIEGDLCTDYLYKDEIYGLPEGEVVVIMEGIHKWWHIDPTTIAIHFPGMLDSGGNKIFASLSKDGKGGDLLEMEGSFENCHTPKSIAIALYSTTKGFKFHAKGWKLFSLHNWLDYTYRDENESNRLGSTYGTLKVIGIQE